MYDAYDAILTAEGYAGDPPSQWGRVWRNAKGSAVQVQNLLRSAYVEEVKTLCLSPMELHVCFHNMEPSNPPINLGRPLSAAQK